MAELGLGRIEQGFWSPLVEVRLGGEGCMLSLRSVSAVHCLLSLVESGQGLAAREDMITIHPCLKGLERP